MQLDLLFLTILVALLLAMGLIYGYRLFRQGLFYKAKNESYNFAKLIGKKAKVIIPLNFKEGTGQVILDGKIWSAINYSHEIVKVGYNVEVIAIEEIKLIVRQVI